MDADVKRYAACEADESSRPVYRVGDDPLGYKRSVRYAAIDVMILTFGALRRAQWLEKIGLCPPDVAQQIQRHMEAVTRIVRRADTPSEPSPHVGPRPTRPPTGESATPDLFDATRAHTAAHTRPNDGRQSGRRDW